MSGPIVRSGPSPQFTKNWESVFGKGGSTAASASGKKTAKKAAAKKSPKKAAGKKAKKSGK
jgi:hypothetical protein